MAKAKKGKSGLAENNPLKSKRFTKTSLVAIRSASSFAIEVGIDFTSGLGQATAVLFRNGVLINMQSISTSGSIHFSDVESRDTVAVNGVCAGDAKISINVPTNPSTPELFTKIIIGGYTII